MEQSKKYKNLIFDVGGVIFDDGKDNMKKVVGEGYDQIYKKAYGKGFKECLLGNKKVSELIEDLKDDELYEKLKYVLSYENLNVSYPIIKENFLYIKSLKDNYDMYLLTNITEDSYNYINSVIDIDSIFKGGIYSYQDGVVKPNFDIYNLLLEKYNLKKEECIFFDDKEKNVMAAKSLGIKSVVFKSLDDLKSSLK
ncbi:MAG: HAD-IA family hydrolase [Bacilli bacterium]|nr:HAD-IA family hydrolase [Bacilli bacterium]